MGSHEKKPIKSDRAASHEVGPLLVTQAARQREYTARKDGYVYMSAHPADVSQLEQEGWEVHKEGSKKVKLRKAKTIDVALEDQMWCLLYRLGYPELGAKGFKIRFVRHDGTVGQKQIDAFAKDDETVIIAECKTKDTRGRKSLQKDILEMEALQKSYANAIKAHYGQAFKPKVIWMFVTQNIIWSESDLERASSANIRVVTENEMQYFDSFARHMGPGGRFQFLAEFLAGQDIPGLAEVRVPATRGQLGKHTFYSFVTTPRHLLKIAFVNHLALNHPDGRPAYQRMVAPSRIKEIGKFIKDGGFFPTNLLVNFTQNCRFDLLSNENNSDPKSKFGWLYLPKQYKSAWIIDGQHRLYGYSHVPDSYWDQNVAVIAFERMDTKDEADLFVTINHKQKSVPRSVIVSLQADLKWGSEDPRERLAALCSRLVKAFNSDSTSPFFQRFALQGVVTKENQSLTMPEVVNGLSRSGLLGKQLVKGLLSPGPLTGATDDDTHERARRFLNGYFMLVRAANAGRWESGRAAYVSTNPGIRAHLLLVADVIKYLQARDDIEPQLLDEETLLKHVKSVIEPILAFLADASEEDVEGKFARKFGEGGVREYADFLCELVHRKTPAFGSDEFKQRLAKRTDERIEQMDIDVKRLNRDVTDFVFETLKQVHGSTLTKSREPAFWAVGVESPKIKESAYSRMVAEGSKHAIEAYVDFIHLKQIVSQKNNWQYFEQVMSIPMKGEKGKHQYLGWMDRFNVLRRVPAHASSERGYEEEDYEFMRFIRAEFDKRRSAQSGTIQSGASE